MTNEMTLNSIKLAANIKIGTRVKAGNVVIRIEKITKNGFEGVNEYAESKGIKSRPTITFDMLMNHHYAGKYTILD